MTFFPAFPYKPHKATPHFVEVCFRFTKTNFFPISLLRFIINRSQTFINAYKLYFVLVHNVYIAHENVELVPVLSSIFCYPLHFFEKLNIHWSISRVNCL